MINISNNYKNTYIKLQDQHSLSFEQKLDAMIMQTRVDTASEIFSVPDIQATIPSTAPSTACRTFGRAGSRYHWFPSWQVADCPLTPFRHCLRVYIHMYKYTVYTHTYMYIAWTVSIHIYLSEIIIRSDETYLVVVAIIIDVVVIVVVLFIYDIVEM